MCLILEREYGLLLLSCPKLDLRGIWLRNSFSALLRDLDSSLLLIWRMGWLARIAFDKRTLGPLELGSPRKAKSFPNLCALGRGWFKVVQSAVETEVLTGTSITLEAWWAGRPHRLQWHLSVPRKARWRKQLAVTYCSLILCTTAGGPPFQRELRAASAAVNGSTTF